MLEEFQIKRAETLLDWGLLPHIGKNPDNRHEKALFLGEAACKLVELKLGWIDSDDKDHYGNKVIKFAGQMLADLFRTAFRNLIRSSKEVGKHLTREFYYLITIMVFVIGVYPT